MLKRVLDLFYDSLVIGTDLDALSYAYYNKSYLIHIRKQKPVIYDIEENWQHKLNLWNKLCFNLSFNGYMPFGDKIYSLRINENILQATTKENLLINIKYNKLFISDAYNLEGLFSDYIIENDFSIIHDYYRFLNIKTYKPTILYSDDNLAKKIYLFSNNKLLEEDDCVATSLVKNSDINSEEYSQGLIRLKLLKMIKMADIKGRKNGNKFKNRPINLQYSKRIITDLSKKKYYNLSNNIYMLDWDWKLHNNEFDIFK